MWKLTVAAVIAGCSALLMAPNAVARNLSYEDNKLNFKACDGKHLTARWNGMEFGLGQPGDSKDTTRQTIDYMSWDGSCQALSWDKNAGKFVHKNNGQSRSSPIVNYVAWDGGKWSATRAGTGFYHVRIVTDGEATADRIDEVTHWLKVHKSDDPAAAVLAQQLGQTTAQ